MAFQLTGSAFQHEGAIPAKHTCEGADISPPLAWQGAPDATKSYALIADDPDAPNGTWVHWVVWNIPPGRTSLEEGIKPDPKLADGTRQGITDFKRPGYGGPCPPSGRHRYYFKIYALDRMLELPSDATKQALKSAMEGHVLATAQYMGTFTRS